MNRQGNKIGIHLTIKKTYLYSLLAFFVAFLYLCNSIGFLPNVPSVFLSLVDVIILIYFLTRKFSIKKYYLFFIGYLLVNLIITRPDPVFRSWQRLIAFILLISFAAPIIQNNRARLLRERTLKMVCYICFILSSLTFVAFFLHINFMSVDGDIIQDFETRAGKFSGLYSHSMITGPLSAISSLFVFYYSYAKGKPMYLLLAIPSIGSMLFAASRAALVSFLVASCVMLYKVSGSKCRFLKYFLFFSLLIGGTFPLWKGGLAGVIEKQEMNEDLGAYGSRTQKWISRAAEIKSSPIVGVGFAAIDPSISFNNVLRHNISKLCFYARAERQIGLYIQD